MSVKKEMGVQKREGEEDEGWEMVSRAEETEKTGQVRHLPIPPLPRPPRSKPIAIPKSLTARRMGRSLSIAWGSHLEGESKISDPGTPGPRDTRFREEPIFVFPSIGKMQGDQWQWPGEEEMRRQDKRLGVHPPFLTTEQRKGERWKVGGKRG
jgi:hypothetical protein